MCKGENNEKCSSNVLNVSVNIEVSEISRVLHMSFWYFALFSLCVLFVDSFLGSFRCEICVMQNDHFTFEFVSYFISFSLELDSSVYISLQQMLDIHFKLLN